MVELPLAHKSYQEYYYLTADGKPDRVNPKTIYVRAVLDAENKALAEDLGNVFTDILYTIHYLINQSSWHR